MSDIICKDGNGDELHVGDKVAYVTSTTGRYV